MVSIPLTGMLELGMPGSVNYMLIFEKRRLKV